MALARSVLPVPGGPTRRMPFGMRPPSFLEGCGVLQELHDLGDLLLRLVDAGDVGEGDAALRLLLAVEHFRTRLAEAEDAVRAVHLAEEEPVEEEHGSENEDEVQGERRKGTLPLADDDLELPVEEVVHQRLVLAGDERNAVGLLDGIALVVKLVGFDFAREVRLAFVAVEEADDRLDDLAVVGRLEEFDLREFARFRRVRIQAIHGKEHDRDKRNHEPRTPGRILLLSHIQKLYQICPRLCARDFDILCGVLPRVGTDNV